MLYITYRLEKQREELPIFYKTRVEEECSRLHTLQELVKEKEVSLRQDETAKLAQLERMRADLLAEMNASRLVMQQGYEEQRYMFCVKIA